MKLTIQQKSNIMKVKEDVVINGSACWYGVVLDETARIIKEASRVEIEDTDIYWVSNGGDLAPDTEDDADEAEEYLDGFEWDEFFDEIEEREAV